MMREVRTGGKSFDRVGNVACWTCHLRTKLDSDLDRRCCCLRRGRGVVLVSSGWDTPLNSSPTLPPTPPDNVEVGSTRRSGGSKCSVRCC